MTIDVHSEITQQRYQDNDNNKRKKNKQKQIESALWPSLFYVFISSIAFLFTLRFLTLIIILP